MWTLTSAALGAVLNRVRGGFLFTLPRIVRIGLLGLACAIFVNTPLDQGGWDIALRLLVGVAFGAMWTFGWGSYMDLGRNPRGFEDDAECCDWIVGSEDEDWAFRTRWVRDAMGLFFRGWMITLLPGLLVLDPVFGLSGALMPVCYELGYRVPCKVKGFIQGPELGEAIFGAWIFYCLV